MIDPLKILGLEEKLVLDPKRSETGAQALETSSSSLTFDISLNMTLENLEDELR